MVQVMIDYFTSCESKGEQVIGYTPLIVVFLDDLYIYIYIIRFTN